MSLKMRCARSEAVQQAKILGLQQMMRKLTARSDWGRLPTVEAEAIDNFVIGFGVEQEEILPTRYVADLSVTYRPDAVRSLLDGAGVIYVEQRSPTLLVLPLLITPNGTALFEPDNSWMNAWRNDINNFQLMRKRLPPAGSAAPSLTAEQALEGDVQALKAYALENGVGDVLVAQAVIDPSVSIPDAIRVRGRYLTPDGALADVVVEVIRNNGQDSASDLYRKAINRIESSLESNWKALALEKFGRKGTLATRVNLARLDQWISIRSILESNELVDTTRMKQFGSGYADIEIDYFGVFSDFVNEMKNEGLLFSQRQGQWHLDVDIAPARPLEPLAPRNDG